MFTSLLDKHHKKRITNEFKDYLVLMLLSVGEVSDRKSINKYEDILEQYIFEFFGDMSPSKQIIVDEILKRVNVQNTQREKLAVFIFEYFFVYSDNWTDHDRLDMRVEFMEKILKSLDANKIP
jgi:hypothetical protein